MDRDERDRRSKPLKSIITGVGDDTCRYACGTDLKYYSFQHFWLDGPALMIFYQQSTPGHASLSL